MDAMLTSGRYLTLIVSLPAACGSKRNRADKEKSRSALGTPALFVRL